MSLSCRFRPAAAAGAAAAAAAAGGAKAPAPAAGAGGASPRTAAAAKKPAAAHKSPRERQIDQLISQQAQFKAAAVEAKKAGDLEQAKEYLRHFKVI